MKFLKPVLTLALTLLLGACAAPDVSHYAAEKPRLELQQYFNGTLDGWGMFQDRSGTVVKRFTVVMQCRWQGDVGTFEEDFVYSDGTRQRRVWTLRKTGKDTFTGTADDVIGTAVGSGAGNALHWNYVLALPVDGKVYNMNMDDSMFLIDERVMLNRTEMSKFGVHLGSVTLSFTKRP
jgi:hypothetical protein